MEQFLIWLDREHFINISHRSCNVYEGNVILHNSINLRMVIVWDVLTVNSVVIEWLSDAFHMDRWCTQTNGHPTMMSPSITITSLLIISKVKTLDWIIWKAGKKIMYKFTQNWRTNFGALSRMSHRTRRTVEYLNIIVHELNYRYINRSLFNHF